MPSGVHLLAALVVPLLLTWAVAVEVSVMAASAQVRSKCRPGYEADAAQPVLVAGTVGGRTSPIQSLASLPDAAAVKAALPADATCSMAAIRLPPVAGFEATPADAHRLRLLLRHSHASELPVITLHGMLWVRISAALYNSVEDYKAVAQALASLAGIAPAAGTEDAEASTAGPSTAPAAGASSAPATGTEAAAESAAGASTAPDPSATDLSVAGEPDEDMAGNTTDADTVSDAAVEEEGLAEVAGEVTEEAVAADAGDSEAAAAASHGTSAAAPKHRTPGKGKKRKRSKK